MLLLRCFVDSLMGRYSGVRLTLCPRKVLRVFWKGTYHHLHDKAMEA